MKIEVKQAAPLGGSALIVTLGFCLILGLLMGSYLSMAKTQNLSIARAQSWHTALIVAEAGIEEGMTHINDTNTLKVGYSPINQWVSLGNSLYAKTNYLGSNYYGVTINAANPTNPVVTSIGYVPGPLSGPMLTRTVQVTTSPIQGTVASGAMVVATTVDFKGFGINTDSFNSANTNLFPGGLYNSTNAMDHGDVSTVSGLTNSLTLGNGHVKGTVHTGPSGVASVGAGGSVGDMNWVTSGNTGIESGHAKADATEVFPDATLPDTGGKLWLPATKGTYLINGVTYNYVLNNTSPWYLNSLDGSVYVKSPGVKLWIKSTFNFPSSGQIMIPSGTSLGMYVTAATASIGGNGVINQTGVARNFQYFGLPSNTSLNFSANAAFVGEIYAPSADFTLGGGGNNTYDFIGCSVTRSAKMNGHFNFHYDENAKVDLVLFGYTVRSWNEL